MGVTSDGGVGGWWTSGLQGFHSDDVKVGLLTTGRLFPLLCQQVAIAPLFFVLFQTISSCNPPAPSPFPLPPRPSPCLTHLHLVCYAAPAICTCLDSNYGVVKAPHFPTKTLPPTPSTPTPLVARKFLLSHTLKSSRIAFKWSSCFSFVCRRHDRY